MMCHELSPARFHDVKCWVWWVVPLEGPCWHLLGYEPPLSDLRLRKTRQSALQIKLLAERTAATPIKSASTASAALLAISIATGRVAEGPAKTGYAAART